MIIVSHHHEHIARCKFLLPAKHHISYTIIIYIGAFVTSCNHHRLIFSHLAVAAGKTLYKFVARHHNDIGKALETDSRQLRYLVVSYHLPDNVGIIKDTGVGSLAQHLVHLYRKHLKSVSPGNNVAHQCRRLFLPDRRQLCTVAYKHQPTVLARINIFHKIIEQTATTKLSTA